MYKEGNFSEVTEPDFERISSWAHYAILSLLELPGFSPKAKEIARLLKISTLQAQSTWDDLIETGIVEKKLGRWVQSKKQITLTNKNSSAATRNFIRGFLKKAEQSMDEEPFSTRNLTTITFAMSEKDVEYAASKIKKFRRKLCKELEERGQRDRVYTLAVQLFPISQKQNAAKEL